MKDGWQLQKLTKLGSITCSRQRGTADARDVDRPSAMALGALSPTPRGQRAPPPPPVGVPPCAGAYPALRGFFAKSRVVRTRLSAASARFPTLAGWYTSRGIFGVVRIFACSAGTITKPQNAVLDFDAFDVPGLLIAAG